jgi:hypothetical protein
MPTEAQINANRLNAQKSTGPTCPAGKAASPLNALKSGIDAFPHIIPGEDPLPTQPLTPPIGFVPQSAPASGAGRAMPCQNPGLTGSPYLHRT